MDPIGKIIIVDDVFSKQECQDIIDYYNSCGSFTEWRGTHPMYIGLDEPTQKNMITKIHECVNKFYEQVKPDWCEIVHWPTGTDQALHLDHQKPINVMSSITYLNDDFEGGHTYFSDGITVVPKTGRTLIFDGCDRLHGVHKVTSGSRYTIPIWWMNKTQETINWQEIQLDKAY